MIFKSEHELEDHIKTIKPLTLQGLNKRLEQDEREPHIYNLMALYDGLFLEGFISPTEYQIKLVGEVVINGRISRKSIVNLYNGQGDTLQNIVNEFNNEL